MIMTLDAITMAYRTQTAYVDSVGTEWVLNDLVGWWGGPKPRTVRDARLAADGSHRQANYRDVRVMTITGTLTALSDLLMRQAELVVINLMPDPALYQLSVTDETGTYVADVELDGEIISRPRENLSSVIFSIQVAAPDPRRFAASWASVSTPPPGSGTGGMDATSGLSATSPGLAAGTPGAAGTATIMQAGTVAVGPIFEIDGPIDNPSVVDATTGRQLSYTGSLAVGDTLWINSDDQGQNHPTIGRVPGHAVLLNGTVNRRASLAVWGGWPVLPPGANRTFALGGSTSGSPILTVHYRSAWR